MTTITRRGPASTELERVDSQLNSVDSSSQEPNTTKRDAVTWESNAEDDEHNTAKQELTMMEELQITKTPSLGAITPERICTAECDACKTTKDINVVLYCPVCKQKLCNLCLAIHNRLGGTRSHYKWSEKCWPESELLEKSVVDKVMKEQKKNIEQLSSDLIESLGIQVCHLYDEDVLELRSPAMDVLELATDTVRAMTESRTAPLMKRVKHGAIEWTLNGHSADVITKLFKDEINSLIETYDVNVSIKLGREVATPTPKKKY